MCACWELPRALFSHGDVVVVKLLWLSHLVPYPPKGGVLQRSYNLLRELAGHHQVTLIAFVQRALLRATSGSVEKGIADAREQLGGFCRAVEFVEIPCERQLGGRLRLALRGLLTDDGYTINWLKSDEMRVALGAAIQKDAFNLIHFDTISLAPYLPLVNDTPAVLDHHNIESHMMFRRAAREPNLFRRVYFAQEARKLRDYENRNCRRFSLHITCSELDGERLRAVDGSLNVRTVPNGVDTEWFYPLDDVEEIPDRLVFAGTLDWYPNREAIRFFTREVWPRLTAIRPGITMDLVGANPDHDLKAFGRSDARFRVRGFVDDVRPYLARAALYVCPIRDGGGTKLKVLDALAMGKAMVADPIACEGIAVTAGRDVEFATEPDEYVRAIVTLLDDRARRRALGDAARRLIADRYGYRQIGARLAGLYEELAIHPEATPRVSNLS